MILCDAVYINESGGKVLFEYFVKNLIATGFVSKYFFLCDSRLESKLFSEINSKQLLLIEASEGNRRKFYKKHEKVISKVFCFANVPPPVKIFNKDVYILFHNALILDNKNMYYDIKSQIKFFLKRLYIRSRTDIKYKWIVQTKNMSRLLSQALNVPLSSIQIIPFYEKNGFKGVNKGLKTNNGNYLYVADGVKQKNHLKLLAAWELVNSQYNIPITLHLTVPPKYLALIDEIERLKRNGLLIVNHGHCSFYELKTLYTNCNYFITPSLAESFGLPLIESAEAGCEIIAADLEYVKDIVIPLATFDPHNEEDIAEKIVQTQMEVYTGKTRLIITNKINILINIITNYV
ncbi:glycosyltransferase [Pedobacter gandavensis]|uniref:glycosyltransferase n=1 Tax=Pedobacter gandavensis TaxID=2679963 RepID=UPI0024799DF8|nr:glycosyltransferase [Pedobacter gandavensis]WGQ07513.1 glycosyltransferase [Pedobacter gandavensis]